MKTLIAAIITTALLTGCGRQATETPRPEVATMDPPQIAITVKSYQDLAAGVKRIADEIQPGSGKTALAMFRSTLGISDMTALDQTKPWQVAIWAETTKAAPSVSLRIPVSDFTRFQQGLTADNILGGFGTTNLVQQVSDYAVIWIEGGKPSETHKEQHDSWTPAGLGAPDSLIGLAINPSEQLRAELLQSITAGRTMITGAMTQIPEGQIPGLDPKALGEMMGIYFDVIELGLNGVRDLEVDLNLEHDALVIDKMLTAKPGSDLEAWLQTDDNTLESVAPFLDPDANATFAMKFGDNHAIMPTLKKYIRLSFQMQGIAADDPAVRETEALMDTMVPLNIAGSVDFTDGIKFGGVYQFPGRDPNALYKIVKDFMSTSMHSMAGEEKMYRSITFDDCIRDVDGVSLDRVSMEINLDSPLYQMPGQKETIEAMWKDGKFVMDLAIKDENMFVGSPELIDQLLNQAPDSKTATLIETNSKTVAYGSMNFLELIPAQLNSNPLVPAEIKQRFANLDAEGAAISFRLDLDNAFHARTRLPVKLFSAIGQMVAGQ